MHAYLPAIGFSAITKTELDELLYRVAQSPDYQEMAIDTDGNQFVELRFMVTDKMGIVIRGTYDDDDQFNMDYYFPAGNGQTHLPSQVLVCHSLKTKAVVHSLAVFYEVY